MAVEKSRGCGYRKVGGLYLCGSGVSLACDRLPYELTLCPTCGAGVRFSRGFQWLDWQGYAGMHEGCYDRSRSSIYAPSCLVCSPVGYPQPYGLLWIGEEHYTPGDFIAEAVSMGVSRRIPAVPRKLKLGETWVLFAHIHAVTKVSTYPAVEEPNLPDTVGFPGVFYAFRPTRIEKLIWKSDAKPELLEDLEKASITPIIIPDGDPDHDPKTPLKPHKEDMKAKDNELFFGSLRARLSK